MNDSDDAPKFRKDWRFYTGMAFFALAWIVPLLALLVPYLGLPGWLAAVVAGGLVIGGPELLALVSLILLGEKTFHYLKVRILSWLRRKSPPRPVSAPRYYVAVTLMVAVSVLQWLGLYFPRLIAPDEMVRVRVWVLLDLIFLTSLLAAGEQFWKKFKRIFVYDPPPAA